jgi:hypothetical protein
MRRLSIMTVYYLPPKDTPNLLLHTGKPLLFHGKALGYPVMTECGIATYTLLESKTEAWDLEMQIKQDQLCPKCFGLRERIELIVGIQKRIKSKRLEKRRIKNRAT